jgi:hypothetical protein
MLFKYVCQYIFTNVLLCRIWNRHLGLLTAQLLLIPIWQYVNSNRSPNQCRHICTERHILWNMIAMLLPSVYINGQSRHLRKLNSEIISFWCIVKYRGALPMHCAIISHWLFLWDQYHYNQHITPHLSDSPYILKTWNRHTILVNRSVPVI